MGAIGQNMAEALEALYNFEFEGRNDVQTTEIANRCLRNINSQTLKSLMKRNLVKKTKTKKSSKPFDSITLEPIPYNEKIRKFDVDDWPNLVYWRPTRKYYWRITLEGLDYVESIIYEGHPKKLSKKVRMDQFVEGIAYDKDLPFGIELEFTTTNFRTIPLREREDRWLPIANKVALAIKRVTGEFPIISMDYGKSDYTKWTVKYDDSCGWEVTSPKLIGKNGLIECISIVKTIKDEIKRGLPVIIDDRTGFHLHLELNIQNVHEQENLIKYIRFYEPSFYSLIPPSRLNNQFCKPFRFSFSKNLLKKFNSINEFRQLFNKLRKLDHYIAINFERFAGPERSTVEIRLHSGTYEWDKVLHWISLWMGIIRNGRYLKKKGVKDEITYPDFSTCGDIINVAKEIQLSNTNLSWLRKRRFRQLKNWYDGGHLSDDDYNNGFNKWYSPT